MRIRIAVFAVFVGSCIGLMAPAAHATETSPENRLTGISRLINEMVARHPEVLVATQAVTAAEFRAQGAARPLYNPAVALNAEDSEENTYTAGLEMPIDLWGKRAVRRSLGEQRLLAAQARLELVKQRITSKLLKALTDWQASREQLLVAEEAEARLAEFSQIAQRRYAAGDIGQVDLDLARLAHAEAVKLSADAAASLADAEAELALISRARHASWPALPENLPDPGSTKLGTTHIVSELPQVRLAWLEREAANADVEVARRDARPDPTIGVEAGREGDATLIGLGVSIPLFVRDPMTDAIDAARADAEAAEIQADDVAQQAGLLIEAAQQRYLTSHAAYERWSAAAGDALGRGLERLNKLLDSGDIDAGFYLLQVQQRLDARAAGAELKSAAWRAWSEWLAATALFQRWLDGTLPVTHFTEMK